MSAEIMSSLIAKRVLSCFLMAGAAFATGCATTSTSNTARTGNEQLLISEAIDRAMSNVHFSDFTGYSVFIDDKYLDSVDKGYLVGTLRHKVLQNGGSLAASADSADLVLEARSGGVGTDTQESWVSQCLMVYRSNANCRCCHRTDANVSQRQNTQRTGGSIGKPLDGDR